MNYGLWMTAYFELNSMFGILIHNNPGSRASLTRAYEYHVLNAHLMVISLKNGKEGQVVNPSH